MSATPSHWIRWPGRLAWVFLALIPLGVLIARSGNWKLGLLVYAVACLLSIIVLALFAVQSLLPKLVQQRGAIARRALPALPGTALLIMALTGPDVPPIHDISTDTADPPRFEAVQALRDTDSNSLEIDEEVIAQQLAGYPDLKTIESARSYGDTYAAALSTAEALGWNIVRDDVNAGFIEAVSKTAIMGFQDDVVIRVRTNGDSSLVDLRSASRVGLSDIGANAKRIKLFQARFRKAIDN
jgi:hypothetical protein